MSIRFYKSSFDLICDELRLNESKQINEGNKINKSSLIYELDKKINISNLSFSYDEKKKSSKKCQF